MKKRIFFLLVALTTFFACERHLLTEEKVVLLSPPNNQNDSILTKLFWWEEMTGATKYQIQVVSPSFDSIVSLVLDSTITKVKFEKTLSPGTYQWRVRAKNSSTTSEWSTFNLIVKNTQSLTGQTIANMSPADLYATNTAKVDFTWDAISTATSYLFKIQNSTTKITEVNQTITTNTYSNTFTSDGTYTWSVQAVNSTSASIAAENSIVIDMTVPNTPSLIWPVLISDSIKITAKTFTWNDGTNSGSAVTDSIWIGTDSLFTISPIIHTVTGSTSYEITNTEFASLNSGKLFWKVRSKDAAGNVGSSSTVKSFTK